MVKEKTQELKKVPISKQTTNSKICFIDGGEADLVESLDISIKMIRLAAIIVQKNRQIKQVRRNTKLTITDTVKSEGDYIIDPTDFQKIQKSTDFRRNLEFRLGIEICSILEPGDIIVLDGEIPKPGEDPGLIETANKKNILVLGISKTTTHIPCLRDHWKYKEAFYLFKEDFYARLNKHSKHIFKIQIDGKSRGRADVSKILGVLASFSTDFAFPGYPYWLIKADQLARISEKESELMKARIILNENDREFLMPYMNLSNAHDILDNMS